MANRWEREGDRATRRTTRPSYTSRLKRAVGVPSRDLLQRLRSGGPFVPYFSIFLEVLLVGSKESRLPKILVQVVPDHGELDEQVPPSRG